MTDKLLTKLHLVYLRLKGDCTGLSESTLVKMSNCWKSHALAQMSFDKIVHEGAKHNEHALPALM